MNPTLESIKNELVQLASVVKTAMPNNEPLNVAHGNWSFPGTTRDELALAATALVQFIDSRGGDELTSNDPLLADYVRRLSSLRTMTVPQLWGSAAAAVPAYLTTLNSLKNALDVAFESDDGAIEANKVEAVKTLKRIMKPLRAIEARISDIDSRSASLNEMVTSIEHAHEAADQLPTDLESLKELREKLDTLLIDSTKDRTAINGKLSEINTIRSQLDLSEKEAAAILERCDASYRATTSEGLASAFSERSRALNNSMWIWVAGLITALILGAVIGSNQLHNLSNSFMNTSTGRQDGAVWIDLLLSALSIGAPVWFAWISTKQIGQRFRLAEDYGYKASISKAYEGYRREAAMLDPAFQARLFSSALTRLDEIPLRLVETDTHGSPWHELASSDLVRQAISTVPGFVDKITEFAKSAMPVASQIKTSSALEQERAKTTATNDTVKE